MVAINDCLNITGESYIDEWILFGFPGFPAQTYIKNRKKHMYSP